MRAERRVTVGSAIAALVAVSCSSPVEVVLPPLETLVASGDSQYGTAGQVLPVPLQVVVRTISTGLPREGVTVVWTVEQGQASIEGVAASATDAAGAASARVRLGSTPGEIRIRAQVREQNPASAEFRLFLVDRPVVSSVSPTSAAPGASVTLQGQNFSPDPEQNVVLFSGIRGLVTAASTTSLTVTVPLCLPARDVRVKVQLGAVGGDSIPFTVTTGGEVRPMQVGEVMDADDLGGFDCVTVPGDGAATYVLMAQSASEVGAATHPFRLTGLSATGAPFLVAPPLQRFSVAQARGGRGPAAGTLGDAEGDGEPDEELQRRLDRTLREIERAATRGRVLGSAEAPAAVPPTVGERRTFQVFDGPGNFTEVTAVAEFVGARAALFVDEDAPAGGLTPDDLAAFSARFDDYIHPTVTGAFGGESDIDGNERVIVLFSPAVNALTPPGSAGFIGGFFFGIDLIPETAGSNGGEIFYTLVPDPNGIFSDPRPKDRILELVPAILAHEFQHMINFNERVLTLGAEANEAIWLSEGLAQYAEELVARAYEDDADVDSADLFRGGARSRSRNYLGRPDTVSVIVAAGQGTLAERGAGFLLTLYLADQYGDAIVGRLTRTTRTGIANVEAETGRLWAPLLADWWAAIRLDGPGPESGPTVYPSVDLRAFLSNPYPLSVEDLGSGDFSRSGSLRSSSVAYYQVTPAAGGSATFRIGGSGGSAGTPQARLQLRIIRVQ